MRGHLRKRGSAWELRAYAGIDPLTKRQKYVTRTFRGGKRDAEEALARLVTEVSGGGHSAQDTSVNDLIREWLAIAGRDWSPTTATRYRWIIDTYVQPSLGPIPLARLRSLDLDRLYSHLRAGGGRDGRALSPATVRQVHAILHRALQQAVRWGWLAANPAGLASPPRITTTGLRPPEPADVMALIATARSRDEDLGCFLHLAATTGARRGELCALRWSDIDEAASALSVTRNVVEDDKRQLIEKDTKTHGSRRIALDGDSLALLVEQRQRMRDRAQACGVTLAPSAHVFSRDADATRPWHPNDVTKAFIRVRKQAGLDHVRLHDLRHFAATRLLAAGVSVRTVSGRLGHTNAATTLGVYAHFVEVSDREAAATLGALLTDPRGGEASR